MNIAKETIVGEIVAKDYRTASVFKQYGIDYCCNGNYSIGEACKQRQVSDQDVINQLKNVVQLQDASSVGYNDWPLDLLADFIEKKHHRYVVEKISEIAPLLHKIVEVHGNRHPELAEVESLFRESAGELTAHMKKEELILFPYVRKMIEAKRIVQAPFRTVQNPISMMMHEHNNEGERFRKIAELTNNYTPPEDACNTYRVTFSLLKEFEEDLHFHIHLENNILFPKSIEMEQLVH